MLKWRARSQKRGGGAASHWFAGRWAGGWSIFDCVGSIDCRVGDARRQGKGIFSRRRGCGGHEKRPPGLAGGRCQKVGRERRSGPLIQPALRSDRVRCVLPDKRDVRFSSHTGKKIETLPDPVSIPKDAVPERSEGSGSLRGVSRPRDLGSRRGRGGGTMSGGLPTGI